MWVNAACVKSRKGQWVPRMVVSHVLWVLGIKLWPSGQTANIFNHGAILQPLIFISNNHWTGKELESLKRTEALLTSISVSIFSHVSILGFWHFFTCEGVLWSLSVCPVWRNNIAKDLHVKEGVIVTNRDIFRDVVRKYSWQSLGFVVCTGSASMCGCLRVCLCLAS